MEDYNVISVEIVQGKSLNDNWKNKMQIVKTDKGNFIDNLPDFQFGCWAAGEKGYNWIDEIGETVNSIKIIRNGGFDWINKI